MCVWASSLWARDSWQQLRAAAGEACDGVVGLANTCASAAVETPTCVPHLIMCLC